MQMLVDLGLPVYVEEFERPFLQATKEFYMVRPQFSVLAARLCGRMSAMRMLKMF